MNPKQFLLWGGAILLLVGILGYMGVLGPTSDKFLGDAWYFDNGENLAHTVLGVVALLASFSLPAGMQKTLVMLVGLLALFFTVYNFFSTEFMGAMLQRPADLILHLVIAIWALWASMGGKDMAAAK